RRESNVTTAFGAPRTPEVGSARIGQPSRAASAATAAGSAPDRPPATITPRCRSSSGATGPLLATARGTGSGGPIGAGTVPTGPSNGSRNGRLRWTGPAVAVANTRWASGRQSAG